MQALTLRIFLSRLKKSLLIANIYIFHDCQRTSPFSTLLVPVQIDWMIDGFNGMSTHLGHVMPKRTMSKTMEKMRQ